MKTSDFDHTLLFEDGTPNINTIKELGSDEFTIITTRTGTAKNFNEIVSFVHEHALNCINIWFVPDEQTKVELIIRLGSSMHFEDCELTIRLLNQRNVNVNNCFDNDKWQELLRKWEIDVT